MSENAKRRRLVNPRASKMADHPDRDEIVAAWTAGAPASRLEAVLRERYPGRPDLWVGDDQIGAFARATAPSDVERRVARGRQFVESASVGRQVPAGQEDVARLEALADTGQRILEWHIGADALGPARARPSAATERAYRAAVATLVALINVKMDVGNEGLQRAPSRLDARSMTVHARVGPGAEDTARLAAARAMLAMDVEARDALMSGGPEARDAALAAVRTAVRKGDTRS
jgi:hypothetical protein